MKYRKDLTGQKYGHWIVIKYDQQRSDEQKQSRWICGCDCGCGLQESKSLASLRQIKVGGCLNTRLNTYNTQSKICLKCGKEFYPKRQANVRNYCYDCIPEESYSTGSQMKKIIKRWALEYKGDKCICCGYNNCTEALEFHHVDAKEKDFSLSDRNIKFNW